MKRSFHYVFYFIMMIDIFDVYYPVIILANVSSNYDNSVIMKSHMIFAMETIIYKDDIFGRVWYLSLSEMISHMCI